MSRRAADALCKECGLCCDGTLFGSVLVQPDERERLSRVGLLVVVGDDGLSLRQRCSSLAGCLCSIYEDRPAACAQYECSLRKGVLAGRKSESEGRADIARMRALLATLGDAFDVPASSDVSVWDALLTLEEPLDITEDAETVRRQDAGIDALAKILELGRSAFEPAFSGGSSATPTSPAIPSAQANESEEK